MSMFSFHLKQPARWLLLAATLGAFSAFAESSQPITLAQAKPTVVISGPGGVPATTASAGGICSTINTGLLTGTKLHPAEVSVGDTYTYTLTVTSASCLANLVVVDTIPSDSTLVSTEPTASVAGNKLTWNLGDLDAGVTKTLKVTVKADKEGTSVSCATFSADPRICAKTIVGRPQLAIEKSGPETAPLGNDVPYSIVVKNVGTAVAKGVVVTDKVPAGLGGPREIPFTVGDLAPGASKTIPVTLKAAERGRHCNLAVATAANATSVQDDACTTVVKPAVKIVKTGTPDQFVGRQATYKIVVSNTGDTVHENTIVTDTAPPQTKIVSAPGANVAGNTATWNLGTLKAGESKELSIVLTSTQIGTWCNAASVTVAAGLKENAEACTIWKGVAGVLVEFVDDPDPISVGDQVVYTIRITNQGNADLNNIATVAESDTEIDFVSSPQGTISGPKKISFPTIPRLGGRQSVTFTFTGKATGVGQAYQKAIVTVEGFRAPIEEYEVTTTY